MEPGIHGVAGGPGTLGNRASRDYGRASTRQTGFAAAVAGEIVAFPLTGVKLPRFTPSWPRRPGLTGRRNLSARKFPDEKYRNNYSSSERASADARRVGAGSGHAPIPAR